MTVAELIKNLQNLPSDHLVVIRGFEGGVDEVTDLEETKVVLDVNQDWNYGSHELLDPRDRSEGDDVAPVVYLRNGA